MLYLVQRSDCTSFRLAADVDPIYAAAFATARGAGVEMIDYDCRVEPHEVVVNRPLPLID